jgi:hypothetical protein
VDSARSVDILGFRAVVEFSANRLLAGVGGKTGDVEGSTWGGGVGHVDGSGSDTTGAEASEEGSTIVLLRYGHLGRVYLEGAEDGRGSTKGQEQGGGRVG